MGGKNDQGSKEEESFDYDEDDRVKAGRQITETTDMKVH